MSFLSDFGIELDLTHVSLLQSDSLQEETTVQDRGQTDSMSKAFWWLHGAENL